jgi:hypothetical protein
LLAAGPCQKEDWLPQVRVLPLGGSELVFESAKGKASAIIGGYRTQLKGNFEVLWFMTWEN